jgi:hypothetical protein
MGFQKLLIREWKQFELLDIEFHPKLTVLTGANSSGKTTILNLLARHFGWDLNELATPAKDEESGLVRFFTRFFKKSQLMEFGSVIGELTYSNGLKASLTVPENSNASYQVSITPIQSVSGMSIPSHREVYSYRPVTQLSIHKRRKADAFHLVSAGIRNRFQGNQGQPTNFYIKDTLLNWAFAGTGNEFIEPDPELIAYYKGFEETLRRILPRSLGFEKITIRNYELILITKSGDFMIDAVSGGVSSLIDLAWQIYMFPRQDSQPVVVLIDEVENHLHATMQRAILPDLLNAFPDTQFIVSTHSPLIVGSVKDSNVYALRYNDATKVSSEKLDLLEKAKTATEILDEVLGVPFTMPIWVETTLRGIIDKYSDQPITQDTFVKMRKDLSDLGLEGLMPLAIKDTLDK